MTMLPVTSLTAGLLAILLVVLSVIVSAGRKAKVDHGDGGNAMLLRRIRTQGNFVEYAPIGLILLGLCETAGAAAGMLWTIAILLLFGRLAHAVGMLTAKLPPRAAGMAMTFGSLLLGSGVLLLGFFA